LKRAPVPLPFRQVHIGLAVVLLAFDEVRLPSAWCESVSP
jgi:hypothetical protein